VTQIGRYEVRRELGRGGTAVVYLAYDPHFRRQVAIKVLPRQFTHDPRYLDRFDQEAHTIATLEHQAIVPVYDFGEHEDAPYLVMRYMAGGTLRDQLQGQPVPLETIAAILQRLAPAVDRAHELGIIHRDIKPANILFDDEENCYLSDFGIARLAEASHTMTVIGTPAYMSPEQVEGDLEVDGRADIYALGVVLYELFTGNQPYTADTPTKQMMAHVLEPVPDVLEANPELPSGAQQIIQKAMAKDREERYASAGELAAAVRELVAVTALGAAAISIESTAGWKGEGLTSQPAVSAASDSQALETDAQGGEGSGLPNWVWWVGGVLILAAAALGIGFIFGRDAEGESQLTAADPAVLQVTDSPSTTQFSETSAISKDVEPAATPDFTLYDDFDDPAFEGSINSGLWTFWDESCQDFAQSDGILSLAQPNTTLDGCTLAIARPSKVRGWQLESIEARMMHPGDGNFVAEWGFGTNLKALMDGQGWVAGCGIQSQPGWTGISFEVSDARLGDESQLYSIEFPIDDDRWYDIRFQVDPETMTFECLVDGTVIGSYTPENTDELRDAFFIRWLDSGGIGGTTNLVDYVRLIRPSIQSELSQQTATIQGNDTSEPAGTEVRGEEVEPAATPDLTLYDDFDDPAYDGSINSGLWGDWTVSECNPSQNGGYLFVETGCGFEVQRPNKVRGRELESIEARMKRPGDDEIAPGSESGTTLETLVDFDPGKFWIAACGIQEVPGWLGIRFNVADTRIGDESELYINEVPIDYDRWYEIRLQIDPQTMTFECLVDDLVMGSYTPDNKDELWDAFFRRFLAGVGTGEAITLVDYVRLIRPPVQSVLVQQTAPAQGNEATEPAGAEVQGEGVEPAATPDLTLYDDFEDPTYDGSYNTALWGDWGVDDCDLFQGDGYLSLTNHCILEVQRPLKIRGKQLESIEARMKRTSVNDISLESASGTDLKALVDFDVGQSWVVGCGILAQPGWLGIHFTVGDNRLGDEGELYISEVQIDYDRWYDIRLQVDPETMTFECLVDGSVMGSFTPQNTEELRDASFRRWLDSYGNEVTLVDYVRLIPPHLQTE
jgi:predicted Ser/Thr protein kinase